MQIVIATARMKALALSFTLVQYDAVTRFRSSAPKFILDVVNNSTVITVIGLSTAVSSIIVTEVHNFSQSHIVKFTKNIAFFIRHQSEIW